MDLRQVEGIDAYNFPADLLGHPLLVWMGSDYVQYIAAELLKRFQEQDPGTEMLAIKCEQRPDLTTTTTQGQVTGVVAEFKLQILLQASDKRCWRLRGDGRFCVANLHETTKTSTEIEFDIHSSEEAE